MAIHRDHDTQDVALHYLHIVARHRYVILSTLAAGVVAAAVVTYRMTPIYRASALVLVEDDAPVMVGIQGVYPADLVRSSLTQCELIKSRSVMRAAARRLRHGWKELGNFEDPGAVLGGMVSVAPVGKTALIRVSAEGPDPKRVDDVATAVVEAFQEESIRRRKSSSEFATGWIEEQVPRLRKEIAAAEDRLREFQREHKILSLDRDQSIVSQRLVRLNQDVTNAERARIDLEAEIAQIEAAGDDPRAIEFLPAVAEDRAVRELDSQIVSLQDRRSDLLRTVRPDHADVKALDSKIADLETRRRMKVKGALWAVRRRLDAARLKERMLRQALAEQEKKALALNEKLIELNALQREVARAKELYEPLLERWGKLDLASGLNTVPVQIIDRAEEPSGPVKPRKPLILAIGAVLGLIAGFQLALILEYSYSRVRSPEDLERAAGLRTVGAIPHMSAKEEKKRFLACHYDRRSAAAEAYRSIRTGLLLAAPGEGPVVFLVTSAVDREGKTTTALNIATALAQTQKRVLVVDADMRRSSVHRAFGMGSTPGLSSCLADGVEAKEVVRESEVPSLSVVTAGAAPENPSELLGSDAMRRFCEWARGNFDFIVMDSPPVAAVTDASVLASLADGVLVVVRAERTPRRAVAVVRDLLKGGGTSGNEGDFSRAAPAAAGESVSGERGRLQPSRVIGAVLNDCPRRHGRYYGYGYDYYRYGHYDRDYGRSEREARS